MLDRSMPTHEGPHFGLKVLAVALIGRTGRLDTAVPTLDQRAQCRADVAHLTFEHEDDAARVSQAGARTRHHEEVGKPGDRNPIERSGFVVPELRNRYAIAADNLHGAQHLGRAEAGGENE